MSHSYEHTQMGWMVLIPFTLIGVIFTFTFQLSLIVLLLIPIVLFYSLKTVVDDEYFRFSFGIGLIRKKFLLSEIESAKEVKNSFIYGWGIHRTRHGWLYNVSGFKAVEITLESGKTFRIGTDEPEELISALGITQM